MNRHGPRTTAVAAFFLGLLAASCGSQDERTATSEQAGVNARDSSTGAARNSSTAVGAAPADASTAAATGASGSAGGSSQGQVSGTEASAVGAVDSRSTPRGIAEVGARPTGQAGVDASAPAE